MEKTRTQKSMTNIIFSLGSQGVELILKVVGRTIFIRYLAIEYLGVNGLFGEILTVLSLAELGIGYVFERLLSLFKKKGGSGI